MAVQAAPEDADLRLAAARFYVDRQYRVDAALLHASKLCVLPSEAPMPWPLWDGLHTCRATLRRRLRCWRSRYLWPHGRLCTGTGLLRYSKRWGSRNGLGAVYNGLGA